MPVRKKASAEDTQIQRIDGLRLVVRQAGGLTVITSPDMSGLCASGASMAEAERAARAMIRQIRELRGFPQPDADEETQESPFESLRRMKISKDLA